MRWEQQSVDSSVLPAGLQAPTPEGALAAATDTTAQHRFSGGPSMGLSFQEMWQIFFSESPAWVASPLFVPNHASHGLLQPKRLQWGLSLGLCLCWSFQSMFVGRNRGGTGDPAGAPASPALDSQPRCPASGAVPLHLLCHWPWTMPHHPWDPCVVRSAPTAGMSPLHPACSDPPWTV